LKNCKRIDLQPTLSVIRKLIDGALPQSVSRRRTAGPAAS
jgi:hypothetical protein